MNDNRQHSMNSVPEHKKGRQLRVVGGSKYAGRRGWVNVSRGVNGYTAKSVYIIYVDVAGNEVEAQHSIRITSVKYVVWDPSATSAVKNQVQRVPEDKKGRQLVVVGGSKYPGRKGWVNVSKGVNGYTGKCSLYIIFVDGGGNEVEAPNCIRVSSVKYIDWDPSATSAIKNQIQRVSEHKKGRQLRVTGGSKYPGKKGWVNVTRGVNGYTPQSVYIIFVDGGGNEVEAPNCIRATSVEYVDWNNERSIDTAHVLDEIVSSSTYSNDKDEFIRELLAANHQLEKLLREEKDKVRRLEDKLQNNMHGASGTHVYIKKEKKVKDRMRSARLRRLAP